MLRILNVRGFGVDGIRSCVAFMPWDLREHLGNFVGLHQ